MKKINNADLNLNYKFKVVRLHGWVFRKRNLGGLIFIDLRDRSGIVQLVIKPNNKYYNIAQNLKNEFVIEVLGTVIERENPNSTLKTGEIEIDVLELIVLNEALELPFELESNSLEETRLKYRYLDLRREELKNNLLTRHKIVTVIRTFLNQLDFIEVETPILSRSTPEGARDYLVPSRTSKGNFYALPQSPQIFKQLLMVGGIEKYYQIARCFRDEDLRSDRQPEFSQIDIEMSFIEEDDIINIIEKMFKKLFKEVKDIDLKLPFLKLKYNDAINLYGSDKPDTRFEMIINDISSIFSNTKFKIFENVLNNKGIINCLVVKNKATEFSRKDIDRLTNYVKKFGASGLAWLKYNDGFSGSISKNLLEDEKMALINELNLECNDLVLIIADKYEIVKRSLGFLRILLGKELNLINESLYNFLWVVDFPLFEYDLETKRYYAMHHPFTSPKTNEINKDSLAKAYDMVLNGYEIGGGSIRIHNKEIQQKMFEFLGMAKDEIENKFGFLLEAFKYGTPPHGGIALGLERIVMLLCSTKNIRDVIAFPKTQSAFCLTTNSPNKVSEEQLKELF